jgi:hypothetical protein
MNATAPIQPITAPRRVPDHDGLAAGISEQIVSLTERMVPGDHADKSKIRFVACAGRRKGAWVVKLVRIPFYAPDSTLLDAARPKWQLVSAFYWGTPSHEVVADMIASCGDRVGFVENRLGEWSDRFTNK